MSGWGTGSRGKLNALKIRIKDCDYEYDPEIPSPDNEDIFCAISKVGSGCHGDSGGPLICEENDQVVLYGAVSTGEDYFGCGSNFDKLLVVSTCVCRFCWVRLINCYLNLR